GAARLQRSVEARFFGQLHDLSIPLGDDGEPLPSAGEIDALFRTTYRAEYGFELPDAGVQIVNLRMAAVLDTGSRAAALLAGQVDAERRGPTDEPTPSLARDGSETTTPLYGIAAAIGAPTPGPAVIEHFGSTVWIPEGRQASIGRNGDILMTSSGDVS